VHLGANRVRHRLRAFLLGWLCLLGLWISVAAGVVTREASQAQSPAQRTSSPAQVLTEYCARDFDGARLSSTTWAKVAPLISWVDEAGWDAATLIEGFTLGAPQAKGNRIEIPVFYEVVGTSISGSPVSRFGKQIETVNFELESIGGTWKITGPVVQPHVSPAALERALLDR
jgi:hypothetical protein